MIKKYAHYTILLLMLSGWFLNAKYYYSRFISEGFDWRLALIIAITFVVFASLCFFGSYKMKEKNKKLWKRTLRIIYIMLAIYSIHCTTAGQYWDQQIKNEEVKTINIDKENNSYWIERYEKKIQDSEKEIERLNEIRNNSIGNLSNMYYYKNTEGKVEKRIEEETIKIEQYENELRKLTNKNKVSAKKKEEITQSKTLYEFYHKTDPELIQFFFQVLLSIFIEAIAQVSIYIFMQLNEKHINKVEKKTSISEEKLLTFAAYAWYEIDINKNDYLSNTKKIYKMSKEYKQDITKKEINTIFQIGLKAGLLQRINGNIKPAVDIKTSEIFYNKILNILGG